MTHGIVSLRQRVHGTTWSTITCTQGNNTLNCTVHVILFFPMHHYCDVIHCYYNFRHWQRLHKQSYSNLHGLSSASIVLQTWQFRGFQGVTWSLTPSTCQPLYKTSAWADNYNLKYAPHGQPLNTLGCCHWQQSIAMEAWTMVWPNEW